MAPVLLLVLFACKAEVEAILDAEVLDFFLLKCLADLSDFSDLTEVTDSGLLSFPDLTVRPKVSNCFCKNSSNSAILPEHSSWFLNHSKRMLPSFDFFNQMILADI